MTARLNRDRQELLSEKPPQVDHKEDFGLAFLTTYSSQHWAIERIIKNDRVLGPLLSDRPRVIFRGASNLRSIDSIAPNVLDPPV